MNEFIYIHPYGNPSEMDIPAGAVGAINSSCLAFKGYYSWEINDSMLERARIAVMDLHWFHSLPGFMTLALELKARRPRIMIIAGGITAGLMSRYVFANARGVPTPQRARL